MHLGFQRVITVILTVTRPVTAFMHDGRGWLQRAGSRPSAPYAPWIDAKSGDILSHRLVNDGRIHRWGDPGVKSDCYVV